MLHDDIAEVRIAAHGSHTGCTGNFRAVGHHTGSGTFVFTGGIDSDTMDAIEAWAADEFRSTNGQLQWIITEALRKAKRLPKKKRNDIEQTNGEEI